MSLEHVETCGPHLLYRDTVEVDSVRLKVWNMIVWLNGGLKCESSQEYA